MSCILKWSLLFNIYFKFQTQQFRTLFYNMLCHCSEAIINVIIVSLSYIFFFVCVCVCLTFPVCLGTVGVGESSCPHTKAHEEQTNIKCKQANYSTYYQLSV